MSGSTLNFLYTVVNETVSSHWRICQLRYSITLELAPPCDYMNSYELDNIKSIITVNYETKHMTMNEMNVSNVLVEKISILDTDTCSII